jgi:hypothetical protein
MNGWSYFNVHDGKKPDSGAAVFVKKSFAPSLSMFGVQKLPIKISSSRKTYLNKFSTRFETRYKSQLSASVLKRILTFFTSAPTKIPKYPKIQFYTVSGRKTFLLFGTKCWINIHGTFKNTTSFPGNQKCAIDYF